MSAAESQEIRLSAVDIESLPRLSSLFDGEMDLVFQRELRRILRNLFDLSVPHDAERVLSWTISFLPDADLQSAVYRISKLDCKAPAGELPTSSRMVFRRSRGKITANLRTGFHTGIACSDEIGGELEVPGLDSFNIDDAWRRELVRVLLNIDDPRAEPDKERHITIALAFKADADRMAVSTTVKRISSKIASTRAPGIPPLFVAPKGNHLEVSFDPSGYLQREDGTIVLARQGTIGDDDADSDTN